jgi:hypothetical protein
VEKSGADFGYAAAGNGGMLCHSHVTIKRGLGMTAANHEDDLWKACAKVGRFLHDFALVEQEINDGIVQLLDLEGAAADVIADNLEFFRKANLLLTVALETAPQPEKEDVEKLFRAIAKQNNYRNLMAHSTFELAADDGVQFRRTVAKDLKIKKQDPLWTKQEFEQSYTRLQDIRDKLTKLRPRLTLSDESKTQLFSNYLNTPVLYLTQATDTPVTVRQDTQLPLRQAEIDQQIAATKPASAPKARNQSEAAQKAWATRRARKAAAAAEEKRPRR